VDNSANTLQQNVHNAVLYLKLRLLEQYQSVLKQELNQEEYSEDDKMGIMKTLTSVVKRKKEIAQQLNIVVSK